MPKNKKLRYFAGPNGSGKSTLFNSLVKIHNTGCFINADRIERLISSNGQLDLLGYGIFCSQDDLDDFLKEKSAGSIVKKAQEKGFSIELEIKDNYLRAVSGKRNSYEASLIASFLRSQLLKRGLNFSFETVMSHPSKLQEIRTAGEKGFKVYLYFICTDDPILNITRIEKRVIEGGHDVPGDKVVSRYEQTLENLHEAIKLAHRSYLFDNSGKAPVMVAEVHNNALSISSDFQPDWFNKFVLPYYS